MSKPDWIVRLDEEKATRRARAREDAARMRTVDPLGRKGGLARHDPYRLPDHERFNNPAPRGASWYEVMLTFSAKFGA